MQVLCRALWFTWSLSVAAFAQALQFEANGPCGTALDGSAAYVSGRSISYGPIIPTERDSISLTILDAFPSTGYSFSKRSVTIGADTVFVDIEISFAGGPQLLEVIPWGVRACLPPQPVGTHIVSISVERETSFGVKAYQQVFPISVISHGSEVPIGIAWLSRNALSEGLGGAYAGGRYSLGIVPEQTWSGGRTRLWMSFQPFAFSIDTTSVSLATDCQGSLQAVGPANMEAEVGCSDWDAGSAVFSLGVTLSDGFSGWADIKVDSLEIMGSRVTQGNVARLTSWSVGSSLEMDFTGDHKVDFDDFFIFADAFGSTNTYFDFNGSGKVDFDDFFLFADSFGKTGGL